MQAIPKSGFTLPNRFARIALQTTEEFVGGGATMAALLNGAGLAHLQDNFPPANLERGFDFSEFAALNLGMEALYGPKGGRGLALRVGRQTFARALSNFGALAGTGDMGFMVLPLGMKLKLGLSALARIFSEISDQTSSLEDHQHEFHFLVHRNAACWSRSGEDKPVCYFMVGLLQETLHSISGGREFRVDEAECQAMGDKACRFLLPKTPLS
jgi:predicted hydrocarbon binding protein